MNSKMCEDCGFRTANVHLTQIIDNEVTGIHLCESCAKNRGISIEINNAHGVLGKNVPEQSIPSKPSASLSLASEEVPDITCPECKTSYGDFRKSGALGCSSCYYAFENEIVELLIQVHGDAFHRGKSYREIDETMMNRTDIQFLRNELQCAVISEKFELAAAIRDKIRNVTKNGYPLKEDA